MKKEKNLTQSLEKYLLAVYEITSKNKAARIKDVSEYLKIGNPAASDAIKTLAQKGYINYVPYGIITITSKGTKKAKKKLERHRIICSFFENALMIEEKKAHEGASDIEYHLDSEIVDKFVQYLSFSKKCSCKNPKWKKSLQYYTQNNEMQQKCQECMASVNECNGGCCCGGCS